MLRSSCVPPNLFEHPAIHNEASVLGQGAIYLAYGRAGVSLGQPRVAA